MTFAAPGDRDHPAWYRAIVWRTHIPAMPGWLQDCRRTDVLLSAVLLAHPRTGPRVRDLIAVVGLPDRVRGTPACGELYYRLYCPPHAEPRHHAVLFCCGARLIGGGTNQLHAFHRRSAPPRNLVPGSRPWAIAT